MLKIKVKLSKQAKKSLEKLERSDNTTARRIGLKISKLSRGEIIGEPLKGATNYSKVRVGKFRIISTIQDDVLLVFIIEKRESVYQTFQHLLKNT